MSVTLKFEQSNLLAGNSTVVFPLSTETAGGSRLDKAGAITMIADAIFQNGSFKMILFRFRTSASVISSGD